MSTVIKIRKKRRQKVFIQCCLHLTQHNSL